VLCDRLDPEEVERARLVSGKHHGKALPPNGVDQRLATKRLSTPLDFIASPLHCVDSRRRSYDSKAERTAITSKNPMT
jgi:hypothetical protein